MAEESLALAFGYPFRQSRWRVLAAGLACLLGFPLGIWLLLGYLVVVARASAAEPAASLPAWHLSPRLLREGIGLAAALALLAAPFAAALWPLSELFYRTAARLASPDPFFERIYAVLAAALILALPWGIAALVLIPPGLARLAASGRTRDLFNVPASLALVRTRFPAWNLVTATVVSAWILGLAAGGLCCLGIFPGLLYALLVSAHASAYLAGTRIQRGDI